MKLITSFNHNNKKSIVIASHSFGEAITKSVIKNRDNMGADITVVLLDDILNKFEIFDECGDTTTIKWFKTPTEVISNSDYLLLNRVMYTPNTLFENFNPIDKEYAQREFEAYIGFSFNAFTGIGNNSPSGVCADSKSLPHQWKIIYKHLNIPVPRYYWGPKAHQALKPSNRLVYSNIYELLNWKISQDNIEGNSIFCFEKPKGDPVFIFCIGRKTILSSNTKISIELENRIRKLAKEINCILKLFISEILFFIEDNNISFGCANHEIIHSKHHPRFDDFVGSNLIKEFYQWAS